MGLNVIGVKAGDKFLGDLAGVSDPETKRKIIGRDFVEVFNDEASRIEDVQLAGAGDDLSRRDRVGVGQRSLGDDQVAPQRRRPAREDATSRSSSRCACSSRTRCAA